MEIIIIVKTGGEESPSIRLAEVLRGIAQDWAPVPKNNNDVPSAYALTEGSHWYSLSGERTMRLSKNGRGTQAPVELRVI